MKLILVIYVIDLSISIKMEFLHFFSILRLQNLVYFTCQHNCISTSHIPGAQLLYASKCNSEGIIKG